MRVSQTSGDSPAAPVSVIHVHIHVDVVVIAIIIIIIGYNGCCAASRSEEFRSISLVNHLIRLNITLVDSVADK